MANAANEGRTLSADNTPKTHKDLRDWALRTYVDPNKRDVQPLCPFPSAGADAPFGAPESSAMTTIANNAEDIRISSRDIAVAAEKRHPDVKRDIRNMLDSLKAAAIKEGAGEVSPGAKFGLPNFGETEAEEKIGPLKFEGTKGGTGVKFGLRNFAQSEANAEEKFGVSRFAHTYFDSQNKEQTEYLLPKDLTMTLITGYRVDLRHKVIKRVEQLEAERLDAPKPQAPAPIFPSIDGARELREQIKLHTEIAAALGLEGNNALLATNAAVRAVLGHDCLGSMGVTHLRSEIQSPILNVSGVAVRLGETPRRTNLLLIKYGYQIAQRDGSGQLYYTPTDKGRQAGAEVADTGKKHGDGTPVTQLRWRDGIVDQLRADIAASENGGA